MNTYDVMTAKSKRTKHMCSILYECKGSKIYSIKVSIKCRLLIQTAFVEQFSRTEPFAKRE